MATEQASKQTPKQAAKTQKKVPDKAKGTKGKTAPAKTTKGSPKPKAPTKQNSVKQNSVKQKQKLKQKQVKLPKAPLDPPRLGDVVEFSMKTRWGINRGNGTVVKLPYTDGITQHRLVVRFAEAGEENDGLVCPFPSQCRVVTRAPGENKIPTEPFYKEIGK